MSLRFLLALFCSSALLLGSLPQVQASNNLYRYQDNNGVPAIGATVPPEYVKYGYEILTPSGRVIEVVPAAPTPEERAAREAAAAEARKREEAARKRAAEDEYLLRVYSKPEEAARARDRRLQELEGVIGLKRGNMQVIMSQIKDIERQAADIERAGRSVPEDMHVQIKRLNTHVNDLEQEIAQGQKDMQAVERDFARKIERLHYLNRLREAKSSNKSPAS